MNEISTWELTDTLRNKFKPIVESYINILEHECTNGDQWKGINLTNEGINPLQLRDLLKELGYEEIGLDTNGWQHDYWLHMTNPNREGYARELCICGTAMSFEIILRSE